MVLINFILFKYGKQKCMHVTISTELIVYIQKWEYTGKLQNQNFTESTIEWGVYDIIRHFGV